MRKDLIEQHWAQWSEDVDIEVIRAPGRINLIGEHIDYHGGIVLPAAIDKAIYMTVARSEGTTEIYSIDHDSWFKMDSDSNPKWTGYLEQLISIAHEHALPMGHFRGVIQSTLPVGAGLSSSAALTTGFIFGLDRIFGWGLSKLEMAEFGQAIEHALGVECGLMDQFAVLHGRQDQVMLLDCLHNTHTYHAADLQGADLILVNSGVSHSLAESAYNERRRVTHDGLQLIREQFPQVASYRDVTLQIIDRSHALDEEQARLAKYIVEEMQRVAATVSAFAAGNAMEVGHHLNASHAGLRDLYQVTCEETDLLVSLAGENQYVLGARQMGGGFGGCVLLLLESDSPVDALQQMCRGYEAHTGIPAHPLAVKIADGVDFA